MSDLMRIFESEPAKECIKHHLRPVALGWHIETWKWIFRFKYSCERELARQMAFWFLKVAYGATDITLHKKVGGPDDEFYAQFNWSEDYPTEHSGSGGSKPPSL